MRRRDLLRSIAAAGAVGTAGCGFLSPACEPTDQPLGDLEDRVDAGENPGTVSVRGVISRPISGTMTIADGTGVGTIVPPLLQEFNPEWLDEGECVAVTGEVLGAYSREYGVLNLKIGSEDDVETVGIDYAKGGSRNLSDEPDVFFDVDYEDGDVRLTHTESETVLAKRLEVRHTTNGWADVSVDRWHELGDTKPDEEIGPGDEITDSRPGSGRLLWRADEHWAYPVSSGWRL